MLTPHHSVCVEASQTPAARAHPGATTYRGPAVKLTFGKYDGEDLEDVPEHYLLWVLDTVTDLSPALRLCIEIHLGLAEKRVEPGDVRDAMAKLLPQWKRVMLGKLAPGELAPAAQIVALGEQTFKNLVGLS
jgi:uncharacterized protein (DUF3820 family)